MSNILLIEPDYRSKFPPLGLLRLATYHKARGDAVTFARGRQPLLRDLKWHRIYVSSLFTYELPRTIRTLKYYSGSVEHESDLIVGGIAATLMPEYIREQVSCRVIQGPLLEPRALYKERKPIAKYIPDYDLIDSAQYNYAPKDSYFCRVTTGCIRRCAFCAVPVIEPKFMYYQSLNKQVREIACAYGERQNLVLLDNNILACKDFAYVVDDIQRAGFGRAAKRNNRERTVDFNQGIDARLINEGVADLLSQIALSPVRLAFDYRSIERSYVRAIKLLAQRGFGEFTNYVMFNFKDSPEDFYYRLRLNTTLSQELGVRITSFPMRYSPINDISRRFVGPHWKWRYIRGIQCVLLATHGLVSPNITFFEAAFGRNPKEFLEILSMPDRYIIYRAKYAADGAKDWTKRFRKLTQSRRNTFLAALSLVNRSRRKKEEISRHKEFRALLEHYYPGGMPPPCL